MIQIRPGIFETNSSSVHAIAVSKNRPTSIPDRIVFYLGDYGWDFEYVEPASYLYTGIMSCDDTELLDKLKERLDELGVKYDFQPVGNKKWYDYGVDHCSELHPILEEIILDKDLLIRFLFSDESFVHTGNDNSYDCEELECNPKIWEYNPDSVRPNPNYDPEHFDYFCKGN